MKESLFRAVPYNSRATEYAICRAALQPGKVKIRRIFLFLRKCAPEYIRPSVPQFFRYCTAAAYSARHMAAQMGPTAPGWPYCAIRENSTSPGRERLRHPVDHAAGCFPVLRAKVADQHTRFQLSVFHFCTGLSGGTSPKCGAWPSRNSPPRQSIFSPGRTGRISGPADRYPPCPQAYGGFPGFHSRPGSFTGTAAGSKDSAMTGVKWVGVTRSMQAAPCAISSP